MPANYESGGSRKNEMFSSGVQKVKDGEWYAYIDYILKGDLTSYVKSSKHTKTKKEAEAELIKLEKWYYEEVARIEEQNNKTTTKVLTWVFIVIVIAIILGAFGII